MKYLVALLLLFAVFLVCVPDALACTSDEYTQSCVLPAAQRPFLTKIPLDCQIWDENGTTFVLRCRINIGLEPRWVPGPKPVVRLPKLPKKARKRAVR